ncbi:dTMP kinase [Amycolatopsis orientalis]|uniref:Thymidylate kinase n=1 Tax=Amycolatopsis orientalis TaxID=31958 RepID=A0A193BYJ5_AMYOR|nr:dTMP kinase [Amycolatopsis orientalis]ANN17243.1 dTMP kinase [Amycolatopsis orientalis]
MIAELQRKPGTLVTLDGPGGVGKTTVAALVAARLSDTGHCVHATSQPSRSTLGEIARHGTDTYQDMALACLCAADRHHQLATEILPALDAGAVVVCDRYLPSSLVLQGLDGIPSDTVWALNQGAYRPDLALVLTGDPVVIDQRLRARGGHSRFERATDNSRLETAGYQHASRFLHAQGWDITTLDCTADTPDALTAKIMDLVHHIRQERPVCR